MSQLPLRQHAPEPDYLRLVRRFPPRRLLSKADQVAAMAAIRDLAVMDEGTLTIGQQNYLDTMTVLLEDYDRRQVDGPAAAKGLPLLKQLMRQHGLSPSTLATRIGVSQPLVARVMAGDRAISLKMMVKLAEYFGLKPAAFFA